MDHRAPEERARQVRRASLRLAGQFAAFTCAWFFLSHIVAPSLLPSVAAFSAWDSVAWGLYIPAAGSLLWLVAGRQLRGSRRAEERLRALLESGSELALFLSSDGVVRYCGPASAALLGRPWQQIEGHNILDFLHAQDAETLQSTLRLLSMPEAPDSWRLESRFRYADGSWRTLDGIGRLALAPDGSTQITILYRDISELKQRELALQDNAQRQRDVIEHLPVGVAGITLRPPATVLSASAPLARFLGYSSAEELAGAVLSGLFYRADDCVAFCERLRAEGHVHDMEVQTRTHDGAPVWTLVAGHAVVHGTASEGQRFDCTFQDVSACRQAELSLREATQALRAAIYGSPAAAITLDALGRVKMWNQAAERLFGWAEQEVAGQPLTAVLVERDLGARALLANLPGDEALAAVEIVCQTRGGQPVRVEISSVPLRDSLGRVGGAAVFAEWRRPFGLPAEPAGDAAGAAEATGQ